MAARFVYLIFISSVILLLGAKTHAQELVSPCPEFFAYEQKDSETNKWYGVITLISDIELTGVWLSIILDSPALELGNWFGDVEEKMDDNRDYLIMNRNFKLVANYPYALRFYIKYDPSKPVPRLESFRLNGRTVCPEGQIITVPPSNFRRLFTNKLSESSITPAPLAPPKNRSASTNNNTRILGLPKSDDDGYLPADFNFSVGVNSNVDCGTIANNATVARSCSKSTSKAISEVVGHLHEEAHDSSLVQATPLITYGQKTEVSKFPWHAALYHIQGVESSYVCGGSLISRLHVLTVAHCVSRASSYSLLNPDNLLVYLGKYYLKKLSDPGIQDHKVSRIVRYPNYNSKTYYNDVAVITLSQPAEYTDFVRPICLWDGSADNLTGKYGTVVGWGYDENGKLTEELKMLNLPVVSKATCINSLPEFFSRYATSKTFCAGLKNGTSICNGDSGGGMIFPKDTGNPKKRVYQIRGIVSVSVALQNESRCDPTHYVVFTDVAKYMDFIKQAIAE